MELLLCTNGSSSSKVALQIGADFAAALDLPTTVLGIAESSRTQEDIRIEVERTLEKLRAAGIKVEGRVVAGQAQQIIPAEAERGHYLTAVGALDPPLWRRLLRGPTMRHLLDALKGPVLCVFHVQEVTPVKKVLICSGGLHHADAAIDLGAQIAAAFNAQVTLLHVVTPHAHFPTHLRDILVSPAAYLQSDTLYARNLQQAMAKLEGLNLSVDFQVRSGEPLLEIMHVAQAGDYDLLVVGSHSAVTGPAQLIGDITHRIVERVRRPVLVVKNSQEYP